MILVAPRIGLESYKILSHLSTYYTDAHQTHWASFPPCGPLWDLGGLWLQFLHHTYGFLFLTFILYCSFTIFSVAIVCVIYWS